MTIVAVTMSLSYLTVAYSHHRSWQLLGVAFAAFQGGLGEASCLALCSLYDSRRTLTLWSSGTGFAGMITVQVICRRFAKLIGCLGTDCICNTCHVLQQQLPCLQYSTEGHVHACRVSPVTGQCAVQIAST